MNNLQRIAYGMMWLGALTASVGYVWLAARFHWVGYLGGAVLVAWLIGLEADYGERVR